MVATPPSRALLLGGLLALLLPLAVACLGGGAPRAPQSSPAGPTPATLTQQWMQQAARDTVPFRAPEAGQVVFLQTFEDTPPGQEPASTRPRDGSGSWAVVEDGARGRMYRGEPTGGVAAVRGFAAAGGGPLALPRRYYVEALVYIEGDERPVPPQVSASLQGYHASSTHFLDVALLGGEEGGLVARRAAGGAPEVLAQCPVEGSAVAGRWYRVGMEVDQRTGEVTAWLDGEARTEPLPELAFLRSYPGEVALRAAGGAARFDDLVVWELP